ncbi:MAG: hypothetical protein AAFV95_23515 [Bacteroidota bacterium]
MNQFLIFNPKRFGQLLRRDLFFASKRVLLIGAGIFTFLVLFALGSFWHRDNDLMEFHQRFFPIILLAGGILFTSSIFREAHQNQSGQIYLTLPASTLEKLLSKLLLSSVIFCVVVTTAYWLTSLLIGAMGSLIFGIDLPSFVPYDYYNRRFIVLFLILQSFFFLGAISFRRYSWVKTGLTAFVTAIVMVLIFALIARLIFWDLFNGWAISRYEVEKVVPSEGFDNFARFQLRHILNFLLYGVTPLLLWTVSFFKLKEKEI